MGQVISKVSRHAQKRRRDPTMAEVLSMHCSVHSPTLMKNSCVWESCWSYFHDAIVKGKLDACRQLLTSERCSTPMCLGALSPAYRLRQLDSIAFSKLRTTALHMAALYRRPDFVQLLLELGSEATVMDGFGRTPAAVLLEHWPRVTLPSLHVPAWNQHTSARDHPHHSDTLLQLWAAQDEGSDRDLHTYGQGRDREIELFREQVAVWRARSTRCLSLLLKHGLGVNDVADRRRASTLLHIAARYDLVDVIELILNAGKDFRHLNHSEYPSELNDYHNTVEETDNIYKNGNVDFRKEIPKPSQAQTKGKSLLPVQMKRAVIRNMRSVVMKSHNCAVHWMWNQGRKNRLCQQGQALRSDSCSQKLKRTSSSVSLLESCASPSSPQNKTGHSAVNVESPQVVADLEVLNATAKTPLAVAVDRGSLNAAHCLLSHGADVFTSDFYGRTILHFLSERDLTFDLLMREVVRQGVDVHCVDNGGNTALHVAAYMGNVSKVHFLLQVGASPDRSNLAGKTPLFLAFQRRDLAARQIILLFLLSSIYVKLRDKLDRLPPVLQRDENTNCYSQLDDLHKTSNTLLRHCIISVRRAIGVSRLLDMSELGSLPCPVSIQQAVLGEEERTIADTLRI